MELTLSIDAIRNLLKDRGRFLTGEHLQLITELQALLIVTSLKKRTYIDALELARIITKHLER